MKNELSEFLNSCVMFGERPTGKYLHLNGKEILIIIRSAGSDGEDNLPVIVNKDLEPYLAKIHTDITNYFNTEIVLNGTELIPEDSPFQYMWVVDDYIVGISVSDIPKE
ncbi:hypothetical protein [Vibrio phage pTD1]|uniref:Uncharacterized protein n=1 Tax=Vibrio phage pTD1 TaxID=1938577 RepID=A0A1Q2U2N9_9CAUD|nr:hypothetical protein FDH33_gp017 [Vibrio phage pTD1]BAW98226.1 hypothetical protein [Vibrio phage pTD1]